MALEWGKWKGETYDPVAMTDSEMKHGKAMIDSLESRAEYAAGAEPLNFEYAFRSGEKLHATQDEEGVAHIVLERNGEVIFDFQSLLPNYTFSTPKYLSAHAAGNADVPSGEWAMDARKKMIFVGDMRNTESIMSLIHEIGHGIDFEEGRDPNTGVTLFVYLAFPMPFATDDRNKVIADISAMERSAWAKGLAVIRGIKKEHGVNLLDGYENMAAVQDSINASLFSHRVSKGSQLKEANARMDENRRSKEGVLRSAAADFKKFFWGDDRLTFLRDLFDKDRLK